MFMCDHSTPPQCHDCTTTEGLAVRTHPWKSHNTIYLVAVVTQLQWEFQLWKRTLFLWNNNHKHNRNFRAGLIQRQNTNVYTCVLNLQVGWVSTFPLWLVEIQAMVYLHRCGCLLSSHRGFSLLPIYHPTTILWGILNVTRCLHTDNKLSPKWKLSSLSSLKNVRKPEQNKLLTNIFPHS